MNYIEIVAAAALTAFGSAVGAGVYSYFSKKQKKKEKEVRARDDKILSKIDLVNGELQILLRYNLQQSAIIATILDAMKTSHVNGNIERAETQLDNAQIELSTAIFGAGNNTEKK